MVDITEYQDLRKKGNFLLKNVVDLYLSIFPTIRYIQALWNLNIIDERDYRDGLEIVDRYSEEPYHTVTRILPKIRRLINDQFPEKAGVTNKLLRLNIIKGLEELNLSKV